VICSASTCAGALALSMWPSECCPVPVWPWSSCRCASSCSLSTPSCNFVSLPYSSSVADSRLHRLVGAQNIRPTTCLRDFLRQRVGVATDATGGFTDPASRAYRITFHLPQPAGLARISAPRRDFERRLLQQSCHLAFAVSVGRHQQWSESHALAGSSDVDCVPYQR